MSIEDLLTQYAGWEEELLNILRKVKDAAVIDEITMRVEELDLSPSINDLLIRYVGWEDELLKN